MKKPLLYLLKIMRSHGPRFIEAADRAIRREAVNQILALVIAMRSNPQSTMLNVKELDRALYAFREHGRIFQEDGE